MFSLLFYGFLIFLLYRLVFHFIIPIYRTTKQVKKGFRDMQDQMRQRTEQQGQPQNTQKKPGVTKVGDYIDFEEVKD